MNFADYVKDEYIGAGIVFITPQKKILLLKKDNGKWNFPGGHKEPEERSPLQTAQRECKEELGFLPEGDIVNKLKLTKNGKPIYSFFMTVKDEFMPTLSHEHKDYSWINYKKIKSETLTSVFKPYWGMYKNVIDSLN